MNEIIEAGEDTLKKQHAAFAANSSNAINELATALVLENQERFKNRNFKSRR